MSTQSNDFLKSSNYYICLLIVTFIIHLWINIQGFNQPLMGKSHAFRQSQTALSTYYLIQNGFTVNYETPVFGKPWENPFEFPIFQWLVAFISKTLNTNLVDTGRLTCLVLFYLSLLILYKILCLFLTKINEKIIPFLLILSSPIYIYWSATFMIESTVLFLSLCYLYNALIVMKNPSYFHLIQACLFGSLTGVTKATIYIIFSFLIFISYIYHLFNCKYDLLKSKNTFSFLQYIIFIFIIPILSTFIWTQHCDSLRLINPIASTSAELKERLYGKLSIRFSKETWKILAYFFKFIYGSHLIPIISLTILFLKKNSFKLISLSLIASYFVGPLIFTKLFYYHDYYYYENGILLLISISISIIVIQRSKYGNILTKIVLIPIILFIFYQKYIQTYHSNQLSGDYKYFSTTHFIQHYTNPSDIIIIWGMGINSIIPYSSNRRALTNDIRAIDSNEFHQAIKNLNNETIGALIIANDKRYEYHHISKLLKLLNFYPIPFFESSQEQIDIYLSKKNINSHNFRKLYSNINLIPDLIETPFTPHTKYELSKSVLQLHPPGKMIFKNINMYTEVTFEYGILSEAYTKHTTDGVKFIIALKSNVNKKQILFSKMLKPKSILSHQGFQEGKILIPIITNPSKLIFITQSGPANNSQYDWAFWRNINFQ